MTDTLKEIWDDQQEFNRHFWPEAETFEGRSSQMKILALHMHAEVSELLRNVKWKVHRAETDLRENRAAILEELTDIFKFLLTMYQVYGFEPEDLLRGYWAKTMVVRQRYSEEFLTDLKGPIAVIDIDNVLCNYSTGLAHWLRDNVGMQDVTSRALSVAETGGWLNAASVGMDPNLWEKVKHLFRTSGGKRGLPAFPGARAFLDRLRGAGLKIVLLTSRPIDEYPNIYSDTLEWLRMHELAYDFVWWSKDKGDELLRRDIAPSVRFAVDDDVLHAVRLSKSGVPVYLLDAHDRNTTPLFGNKVTRVRSLEDVLAKEGL